MTNFSISGDSKNYITRKSPTKLGTTDIKVGDLVVLSSSNPGYKEFAGAITSTSEGVGIAISNSTHTSALDGLVEWAFSNSGIIVTGKVTTPANLATALNETNVTLDVSGSTQTVDENDVTSGAITILSPKNGDIFDTVDGIHDFLIKANN